MSRNVLLTSLLLAGIALSGSSLAADEPSLHQVYTAANAGRLTEAQSMMEQVLRKHPNSAKAHFVEAEILAKGGQLSRAQSELADAERLAPGLPFAKLESVEKLRRHLSTGSGPVARPSMQSSRQVAPVPSSNDIPWGMLLLGLGAVAAVIVIVQFLRRQPVVYSGSGMAGPGYPGGNAAQPYGPVRPYGPTYGPAPMGMGPYAGGGMGSGILGGLATGAAMGAGMVAGEALMHHFTDSGNANAAPMPPAENWNAPPDDMGGSDFGISDGASWDDSSAGGDW